MKADLVHVDARAAAVVRKTIGRLGGIAVAEQLIPRGGHARCQLVSRRMSGYFSSVSCAKSRQRVGPARMVAPSDADACVAAVLREITDRLAWIAIAGRLTLHGGLARYSLVLLPLSRRFLLGRLR